MISDPELSVIICTYNRVKSLPNVLNDLIRQVYPDGAFPWELVLVDNNSNDGTKEVVQQYEEDGRLPIRYLFEPQQGKSFALNSGVKAAKGKLLSFTDDDVVLDSRWLYSVYTAFKTSAYKCFGGRVFSVLEGSLPDWISGKGKYSIVNGPLVQHDRGDKVKEYDQNMWVPAGCNMFFRKEVVEKHGYFSTELGFYSKNTLIYGEDSELMFRFKNGGESILYYPDAVVYHPAYADRLRKSYFKRYFWGMGRGTARWASVPPGTVRYANVPRYLIRQAAEQVLLLAIALVCSNKQKRFFHEVKLVNLLGIMREFYFNGD